MFFSVLMVVRNEENYIASLLDAVLHQDYPAEDYEIIVVDGHSTDRTREVVNQFITSYPSRIRMLMNDKKTLPAGWNIGIKEAKGRYVIRLDGHSHIPEDFLKNNREVIERNPSAACVGGVIESVGNSFWGKVNSYVYSHPFGVGNSKFRTTKHEWEGQVDTVPYGAYKREIFEIVGYFQEELKRNEDLEMHARIRQAGMIFYLSTKIRSVYFVRETLSGLIHKAWGDGRWTMIASTYGKQVLRIRHMLPLIAFVLGLTLLVGAIFLRSMMWFFIFICTLYLLLVFISSWNVMKLNSGFKYLIPTMIAFISLHVVRGAASFLGLFSAHFRKKK